MKEKSLSLLYCVPPWAAEWEVIMKTGRELIKDINNALVDKGKAAFWWLGQMGVAMKIGETVIYIDAYLSDNPRRTVAPLLKPEELNNADIIIGSHDHSDHIDRKVWKQLSLSSPNAKFIVPSMVLESVSTDLDIPKDKFIGLDEGKSATIKDLTITGIASAHELLHQNEETGEYPFLGFIIEGNGTKTYHAGDTCIYPGLYGKLEKWGKFDLMFIPINGRDAVRYKSNTIGNMTYQEAVDLAGHLRPELVIPGHYEMFKHNGEDPELFIEYLQAKYPGVNHWVGGHGEMILS